MANSGLGKGLSALIPEQSEGKEERILYTPIGKIKAIAMTSIVKPINCVVFCVFISSIKLL